jgi:serine protease Do
MAQRPFKPLLWAVTLIVLISLACGPSGTPEPTQAPAPTSPPTKEAPVETKAPPPTEAPAPTANTLEVNTLGDVQKAVIQIEAEGTFIDPEVGWNVNVGKLGSGVIIDPSGIAVTNNHVVTGAALLRVWVGGDTNKTYNAKVLGVSECSDLAIIDIEGDGFSYLSWFQGDIQVGQQVYAAGYPLGDPRFTLTDGIVSKVAADGETSWASVDSVIEHTAKINPGNSGGPLVDANGRLIGINYAIVSATDQNFAISRDEALPVLDQLRLGKNVDSIGVNGGAVSGYIGDTPIYGVWVRSIASGSPADNAGIMPGDIIYQLENEVLATDGTMADYCDILRSRNSGDTMQVTVIRWSDLSLLEGQLNGRSLALTGYFDTGTSGGNTGGDTGGGTGGDTSTLPYNCDYATTDGWLYCWDDTSTIVVEIPYYWVETNGGTWQYSGDEIGVAISAAPVLNDFYNYVEPEGIFFGASGTFAQWGGYVQFLDYYTGFYKDACKYGGRYDYDDGLYRGKYDYYYNCGGAGGTDSYVLTAVPISSPTSAIIVIYIQVPKGDTTIRDHIWNTFVIVGNL